MSRQPAVVVVAVCDARKFSVVTRAVKFRTEYGITNVSEGFHYRATGNPLGGFSVEIWPPIYLINRILVISLGKTLHCLGRFIETLLDLCNTRTAFSLWSR